MAEVRPCQFWGLPVTFAATSTTIKSSAAFDGRTIPTFVDARPTQPLLTSRKVYAAAPKIGPDVPQPHIFGLRPLISSQHTVRARRRVVLFMFVRRGSLVHSKDRIEWSLRPVEWSP